MARILWNRDTSSDEVLVDVPELQRLLDRATSALNETHDLHLGIAALEPRVVYTFTPTEAVDNGGHFDEELARITGQHWADQWRERHPTPWRTEATTSW